MSALNRESYDAIATEWNEVRVAASPLELGFLDRLLDGLSAGASVLDLGCGSGRPLGAEIVRRGMQYTGIDQSTEMLRIARTHLPDATLDVATLETFRASRGFDAILCWDALFHIVRTAHESILLEVARALKPGGRFMCTVGGSEHPAFTDTMFSHEFFYDSHPPEVALALLARVGLEPEHHEFLNVPTSGRDKGRYGIIARRAATG